MKTIAIAAVVAGTAISGQSLANGIYVGGNVGMGNTSVELTSTAFKLNTGNSDPVYGAFIGYELNSDKRMQMAIELDGTFGNIKSVLTVDSGAMEVTRKNAWGLHLLVGFPMTSNADIYFRLGGVKGSFDAEASNGSSLTTADKTENGWVLGVGSRFALDDRMNLRLDYRYTQFNKFKFAEDGFEFNVKEQYFTAGLQYMF